MLDHPYRKRSIRFLELWSHGGWRLKVYGISFDRPQPAPLLIAAAKQAAGKRLDQVAPGSHHYSVGFLGIHEGRTSNFVFVSWWAEGNELFHHVYVSPKQQPGELQYVTPTGLTACVWDLRVLCFERQAWLETILQPAAAPDFEAYLERRLEEEV